MMPRPLRLIARLAAVSLLATAAACGVRGDLERPPPLWGEDRAKWEAEQTARAEAAEAAKRKKEEERARGVIAVSPQAAPQPAPPAPPQPAPAVSPPNPPQ